MGADLIKPPPWRRFWPAALAALVWTAAVVIGTAVYLAIPIPPVKSPVEITANRAFWTPEGTWRVETDVKISDHCRIVVSRRFAADGDLQREPSSTYLGRRIGELPYLLEVRPWSGTVWYEYAIQPGHFADYLIEATAWQCDGGYSGTIGRWLVPVGKP